VRPCEDVAGGDEITELLALALGAPQDGERLAPQRRLEPRLRHVGGVGVLEDDVPDQHSVEGRLLVGQHGVPRALHAPRSRRRAARPAPWAAGRVCGSTRASPAVARSQRPRGWSLVLATVSGSSRLSAKTSIRTITPAGQIDGVPVL
jgi:hypothetical protein